MTNPVLCYFKTKIQFCILNTSDLTCWCSKNNIIHVQHFARIVSVVCNINDPDKPEFSSVYIQILVPRHIKRIIFKSSINSSFTIFSWIVGAATILNLVPEQFELINAAKNKCSSVNLNIYFLEKKQDKIKPLINFNSVKSIKFIF